MKDKHSVSIIIPTLNEERALPATLESIFQQDLAPDEIIIVDGGSQDNTCHIVTQYPYIHLIHSPSTGRAIQMNQGAKTANGECLLFLHADTLLPSNAISEIKKLSQDGRLFAGCFQQQFSPSGFLLQFISFLHNLRCKITHIMYGDQSIFVKKSIFQQVGGYPDGIIEDVRFSEAILPLGKPKLLKSYVKTDSRKFIQRGVFRSLIDVVAIIISYQCKKDIPKFSRSFFSDIR